MSAIKLAIVGVGKIARDQHLPVLAGDSDYEVVAAVDPNNRIDSLPSYPDIDSLLCERTEIQAVAICTPPQARYEIARHALEKGCHVLLEKPPGATLTEVAALAELARERSITLFATWHSREAAAVEPARAWLAQREVRLVKVTWKEDVREWHPGQRWIWRAGGFGVFDPGINALSIVTHILPRPILLQSAELSFPSNCDMPIAARLVLQGPAGLPVLAEFDFLQPGPPSWDIDVETSAGRLQLSKGGSAMRIDDEPVLHETDREYARIYARFAALIRERRIDVDIAPLRLVADAFLCGQRVTVEPFFDEAPGSAAQ